MTTFTYRALDAAGRHKRGRSEAASAGALTRTLQRDGLLVLELNVAEEAALGSGRIGRTRNGSNFLALALHCLAVRRDRGVYRAGAAAGHLRINAGSFR
jgi:type II secretory pathway component PulF